VPSYLYDVTFHLTEECNTGCRYCYQTRRTRSLPFSTIRTALDFFQDALQPRSFISFYGGEPLLAIDTIRRTLAHIQKRPGLRTKRIRYSLSTNGTLLTEKTLRFLDAHRFRVNLSHDGTAQETTRPSRMNALVLENLDRMIRFKGIELSTNSVFIPATVGELYRSVRFLLDRGVKDCSFTYSVNSSWDSVSLERMRKQVHELSRFLLHHYRLHSTIPVGNFRERPRRSAFWCTAGQDRLALAADGRLWGCRFFADFFADKPAHPGFQNYCFGDFRQFMDRPRDAYSPVHRSYGLLRQEAFSSEKKACRECRRLSSCSACPAVAAFSTGVIGRIPGWMCEMKKLWRDEIGRFWKAAGSS